ncbi:MAG TPA: GNAT family N-acetyltransferase, partial [Bacteroidia bacterium]
MPDCALVISDKANKNEVVDCIIDWLEQYSNKKNYAQFIFNVSYKYSGLFERHGLKYGEHKKKHTYVLDLTQVSDVQNLYAPKRRQQIRRAVKDGLQVKHIEDLHIVFLLVCQTFKRQGKAIDEKMVKKILFDFATSKNSFAFATVKDGEPIVAYFCIYHNKEAFYLLGGFNEDHKHIGAGPLAMSACIEHAKKIGVEIFDFEGSMEPSIEKYFKEFGGTKKNYISYERTGKLGQVAVKLRKLIKG